MKLLPLVLSLAAAGKKSSTQCGCDVDEIAEWFIEDGSGTAECTKPGKKGSKGSTWLLKCDNGVSKSIKMGKNCKLKGELSCNSGGGGGGDEDASCKSLATLEKANPDATFTCVGSSEKKETVKCAIGDKFDQITGKTKHLLKWATSAACTESGGGGGGGQFTCACQDEVADFADIQCVAANTYSCMQTNGQVGTFKVPKKCKKIAKNSKCAENDDNGDGDTTEAPPTGDSDCKILALHGGGGSSSSFRNQDGMIDLMNALQSDGCVFVFGDAPEAGGVWFRDPPGGNKDPTTDPNWGDATINYLDQMVATHGPFYALLGYSQGSAAIPVYLANTSHTFNRVMMYNGYLPTQHEGLMGTVDTATPFAIEAMVFSGENDEWFGPLAPAQAARFANVVEVHSDEAGHELPLADDDTFQATLDFIRAGL